MNTITFWVRLIASLVLMFSAGASVREDKLGVVIGALFVLMAVIAVPVERRP